ncbi:hypothetical protein IVB22_14170 [Bradyrhizobium sp. 190]|uniref:hypothetical protein n=1 Tax=Bradyrhizobium sp. 190 TaxID=2782658 RepID=UPI001FFB0700|nr:hypothetical protein [Bradyrhizobium sp. 190]MCK1513698.1 hypothetical protein [Bradyrhizobium sp. 190]
MADRSGVRLEGDVTMEGERESFSNRCAKRKILSEINVLTACSACSIFRKGAKGCGSPELNFWHAQSEIVEKLPRKGV